MVVVVLVFGCGCVAVVVEKLEVESSEKKRPKGPLWGKEL